jgi:drug/metabolite transporter (DMT)-like permease
MPLSPRTTPMPPSDKPGLLAIGALLASPVLFSSNAIIGSTLVATIGPWTLAWLRWTLAVLVLLPFIWRDLVGHRAALRARWRLLLTLGLLGMWLSGGGFYAALRLTTATNGTVIYTVTPLIILVLERVFRGRRIAPREMAGILVASLGVGMIVTRGSPLALLSLDLNPGDVLVLVCATAWAVYTVVLRRGELTALPVPVVFVGAAAGGVAVLTPFMIAETLLTGSFPSAPQQWLSIAALAVFASNLAFLSYQYAVAALGPTLSGLSMYLTPISGVTLAVLILGERPGLPVFFGSALVLAGIVAATAPVDLMRRLFWRS